MPEPTRDPKAALKALGGTKRLLVTTHSVPDGDAIGSELGFAELAEALGVSVDIVNHDLHPASLGFLPGLERIRIASELPAGFEQHYDMAVVLECPGIDRPGFAGLDRLRVLNIDHHLGNTLYGKVNFVDEEAAAVGEMVLAMAEAAGTTVTPSMATNLYVALVTDTGDFRYPNTTPRALAAASRLLMAGAKPAAIAEALWENIPARVVRLQAEVLNTLDLLANGRLAVIHCDRTMLDRAGAESRDTEDFINIPRAIETVRIVVFLKAFLDGAVRVSFRSRGDLDVEAVAETFGGGGHRNAAGCTVAGTLEEVRSRVIEAMWPLLEKR